MPKYISKILALFIILTVWETVFRPLFVVERTQAQAPAAQPTADNDEVRRLSDADQADRTPPEGTPIDWAKIVPRDRARLKRVKEIYAQDLLRTANDYDRAAIVLMHSEVAEDHLLAHEFWVVAISKGKNDKDTLGMAAASEDRFLMNIGRPQRFGTQLRSENSGPLVLYPVDAGVTDELRRVMGGHALAEIKARVAEMNQK